VYAAALAAMPLIQKAGEGLAARVANGIAGFFATPPAGADGQNAPTGQANSAQSAAIATLNATLGPAATNAILTLQNGAAAHHHHHGLAGYKAAANLADPVSTPTGATAITA